MLQSLDVTETKRKPGRPKGTGKQEKPAEKPAETTRPTVRLTAEQDALLEAYKAATGLPTKEIAIIRAIEVAAEAHEEREFIRRRKEAILKGEIPGKPRKQ